MVNKQGVINVNIDPFKEKTKLMPNKNQRFSLFRGIKFFVLSNIILVSSILFFIVNKIEWQHADSSTLVEIFAVLAEIFIIMLSIISCIEPKKDKIKNRNKGEPVKEWIGALVAFILLSLLSLIFLGLNIPYPSTLILCIIFTNFMVALYSILFHPIAIGIYEANVYEERTTMLDYIFKYIAIYFSGINYYVQRTLLLRLPIIINKLIAIIFVLFLLLQAATLILVFDF